MNWINQMLGRGGTQVKKVAYIFVVFCGMACLIMDLQIERKLSTTWVTAFGLLTGFVTSGYAIGKAIDKGTP